ncbi:MAG: cyclohexanecarboxylate-CoA ligase [Rhizobiaceae bacterium]|nr:MAG: cyclohexanecarboxylate-CoA ligase [Rhizobiaceae bacterium]
MRFVPTYASRRSDMIAQGLWRDRTLLDHLDRVLHASPDKEALVVYRADAAQEKRMTYREVDALATRLAAGLKAHGIGRGDVVSFQLPNWWEFFVLHIACLRIGAVSNPLMVIFRERELRFMLGLAASRILIVPKVFRGFDYAAMARGLKTELPELQHVFIVDGDGPEAFTTLIESGGNAVPARGERAAPDDVIQLLYTSGTTGEPKGVTHSSNTMLANLEPFAERLGLGSGDVIHMPSPMGHQLGFMYGLVLPVMLGASAVLQDIFDPEAMTRQIVEEKATFTMGATPFLSGFVDHVAKSGAATPSLRVFVSAGAPIPRALVTKGRETLGAAIISGWGMSENGAVTTTKVDDSEELTTNTDGCALPGMEVKVVGHSGKPVPSGEEGRLMVRGCSNFAGYHKRPGLGQYDEEGWFDTGDIARMDKQGYIRICGRAKDIIMRGGENIPVVEVEGLLYKHPAISGVAIVGYPDRRLGERACAFVTLREGASLTFEEMTDFLRAQKMAIQYIPERMEIVKELPRTPSGKVQKFKLREAAAKATA